MTSACELSTSNEQGCFGGGFEAGFGGPVADHFEAGRIKGVCLDLDDTLLDNAESSRSGLRALVGNDAAWPVWRRTTDEHYARFVAGEIDFDSMCTARTRAFFAAFGEDLSDGEAAERERVRMAAMQRAWRLFDDVVPCLEWLRTAGLRLAIITNAPGGYQRKKIATVGLAGFFDALLISGEVGVAKPDPGIFASACSALDLHPSEVAHVGDRLDIDAIGAADAGMHGVWLNRDNRERVPADGVGAQQRHERVRTSTIVSLDELPELLVCDLPPRCDREAVVCEPRCADAGNGGRLWSQASSGAVHQR